MSSLVNTSSLIGNQNHKEEQKQRSYQVIKTSVLVFEAINDRKNKKQNFYQVSENSRFKFYSLKTSKRTRNKRYQGTELAVLVFEVRNEVKEPETKFLLSHENLPL